jgi:hypothetical protein
MVLQALDILVSLGLVSIVDLLLHQGPLLDLLLLRDFIPIMAREKTGLDITKSSRPFVVEAEEGTPVVHRVAEEATNSISPAGNITRYIQNWHLVTNNNFILRIVSEGYKLQFLQSIDLPPSILPLLKIQILLDLFLVKFKNIFYLVQFRRSLPLPIIYCQEYSQLKKPMVMTD